MTLLRNDETPEDLMNMSVRSFPQRRLNTEGPPANLAIFYKDRWTVPDFSVYAIVFPKYYVATRFNLIREENDFTPEMLGINKSEQLFFHTIFQPMDNRSDRHVFDIEALLIKDEQKYNKLASSVDVVEGTSRFGEFRHSIRREAASPDFWFRLLEFGSKFIPKYP